MSGGEVSADGYVGAVDVAAGIRHSLMAYPEGQALTFANIANRSRAASAVESRSFYGRGRRVANKDSIEKPLASRVSELLQGLLVVRDAVEGMSKGSRHQAIALTAQLRALLLEKRSDSLPLLLSVMDDLGLSHQLYAMPASGMPEGLPEPVFTLSGPPFTRSRVLRHQVEVDLAQLADHPVVQFQGSTYSLGDIVRFFANKGGGAHYAKALPEDFAHMLELGAPNIIEMRTALLNVLMQVGQAVVDVGVELLRSTSDVELFIDARVVHRSTGAFIDLVHPDLPMRLGVGLTQNAMLVAQAVGIDGTAIGARVEALLDWGRGHHLRVQLRHSDNMGAELDVLVDGGEAVASSTVDLPVFLPMSSIQEFNLHVNGGNAGNPWDGSIALGSVMLRGVTSPVDEAHALLSTLAATEDADRKAVLYKVGGRGLSPSGQRDIGNSEGVVMSRMSAASDASSDGGPASGVAGDAQGSRGE